MSKDSKVPWAHHTLAPWLVCSKVDACCTNCYSEAMTGKFYSARIREAYRLAGIDDYDTRPVWGDHAPRVLTQGFSDGVERLNRAAAKAGERRRIFMSLIDPFDAMPAGAITLDGHWMARSACLLRVVNAIRSSPCLDWLLLTKRPQLWRPGLELLVKECRSPLDADAVAWARSWLGGKAPPNVWFGYTAGTAREWRERHDIAKHIPALVTWCSAEPLLEPFGFSELLQDEEVSCSHYLDWIVVGGESGPSFRDRGVDLLINLVRDAQAHQCAVWFKQDYGRKPDKQGRIPDDLWALKELPLGAGICAH